MDLLDKDFELAVLNVFKELKETMTKEIEKSMRIMCHQIENVNKIFKKEIIKKEPNGNSAIKNFNNWN